MSDDYAKKVDAFQIWIEKHVDSCEFHDMQSSMEFTPNGETILEHITETFGPEDLFADKIQDIRDRAYADGANGVAID